MLALAHPLGLRCLAAAALEDRRHQSVASSSRAIDRNSSGDTRIAAPVGHARTHAGPPEMPLHMSHFTAILDRKSVVKAKSASGRVDPGGRSIITTKKTQQHNSL